jgi:hypothetical protein
MASASFSYTHFTLTPQYLPTLFFSRHELPTWGDTAREYFFGSARLVARGAGYPAGLSVVVVLGLLFG